MTDRFDLERFVTAQEPVIDTVLSELGEAGSGATGKRPGERRHGIGGVTVRGKPGRVGGSEKLRMPQ